MSEKLKAIGISVVASIIAVVLIWRLPSFFAQISIDTVQVETGIFELINEERTNRGLPALSNDDSLETIALEWSAHLAEIDDLTHGDFEGRFAGIGYSEYQCGEIIAMYEGWSSNLGRQFVDMWLDSPGHYHVMMTPKGGFMGVDVSKGRGFFAVVDFRFTESESSARIES